jgi:uncharacterized phage protein (TIGR01671 family)
MRTIKFRGLTGNDNWVYGHYFYDPVHDAHQIIGQGAIFYTVKPETVSEWTGLLDKNGKEIYESDLVQFKGMSGQVPVKQIGEVWWQPNGAYFAIDWSHTKGETKNEVQMHHSREIEVIGSIYDNPDLLTQ